MSSFPQEYSILIEGHLPDRWNDWFEGMTVTNLDNDEVLLQGTIQDQSVLVGVINQLHNLNLVLVSIDRQNHPKHLPEENDSR